MDKVIIKSKYNKKYHYKFYSFHMFRKSASIYLFLIAGILSIYLVVSNSFNPEVSSTNRATSWAFFVLIFLSLPFFTIGKIRGIVNRNAKDRKDNYEVIEITKYKITRFIENIEGKAVIGWENFESVYELKEFYLMYVDKDRGLVIPKADMVEGSPEIFEKLVKNNLKPNKKGKVNFKKVYKENK
ncbi:MAG: YcxB family protein [Bacilli bacterium]|nr:YcxB family protein [Bacilli bacterium]